VDTEHPSKRWFASDNNASVHPAIMEALDRANHGHAIAYGDDVITARVLGLFSETFGAQSETFLVWNGTGANVMAIAAATRPWEGVVCTDLAHIDVDETGAAEHIAGVKLFTVPGTDGKLTPDAIRDRVSGLGRVHSNLPRLVSISQPTETGLVYGIEELAALGELCRERGLHLHVDGARLANAAVSLGVGLREAAGPADVLSFGGTKNGLMFGEAVVFLNPALAQGAGHLRKNVLQLDCKMRYLAAQYEAYLADGLWRANAAHANDIARRLGEAAAGRLGLRLAYARHANIVFAELPPGAIDAALENWFFYVDRATSVARWVCSWDNTAEDVSAFADDLAAALGRA